MRFFFANNKHPMEIAKKLKAMFPDKIKSLGRAQEIVAKVFGWENWHEFSKATKEGKERPTEWDDEVSAEEAGSRQLVLEGRFSSLLEIDTAESNRLVGDLRPLARLSTAKSKAPEWLERLNDPTYKDRFFGPFNRSSSTVIGEYERDLKKPGNYLLEFEHGGLALRVYAERGQDFSEVKGCGARRFLSILVSDKTIVGFLNGVLFKVNSPSSMADWAYQELFDAIDDQSFQMGMGLVEDGRIERLFKGGKSTIFITDFQVLRQTLPPQTGLRYLREIGALLRETDKSFGSVVFLVDPPQYASLDVNNRLHNKQYNAAVSNLVSYLEKNDVGKLFGPKCVLFSVVKEQSETGDPRMDVMLKLGASQLSQNPHAGSFVDSLMFASDPHLREALEFTARQALSPFVEATRTSPDEPAPFSAENPFPSDFNVAVANAQRSLQPHKDFWHHMPSDLIQVTVTYKTALPGFDRHNPNFGDDPLHDIEYRFRNGTHLVLRSEELILGPSGENLPASAVGPTGIPLTKNPFTDRYGTEMLVFTLKVNSLLLFRGDPTPVVWAPGAPVSYTRP